MPEEPKISIVIPTKNRQDHLKRLLASVQKSAYKNYEIIIVNDGDEISPFSKSSHIHVLQNNSNQGLAFSRTRGAKKAKGEYVLFIDDDNVVDKNMLEMLANSLTSNSTLFAVGPATYYFSNKNKIWFLGSSINLRTSIPIFKRKYERRELQKGNLLQTENLHNCFMVYKKYGDEVGWFDPFVFMNGTEFDLFQRIKKKHPTKYLATVINAKCYHDVPEFHKDLLRSMGFDNKERVYYFQRNRGLHVGRYGRMLDKLSLLIVFYPLFLIVYSLLFLYYRRGDFFLAHSRATFDGYKILLKTLV
ncbi:MAG: glycosyltransferase family 2 protein [Candidatus Levybacteria bacterium]|nr:glycosyltransferase family 2 protein [Candidatus Levybacteria bacterium]